MHDIATAPHVRSVYLAVKRGSAPAMELGREIRETLAGLGVACLLREQPGGGVPIPEPGGPQAFDLALVLGGDGTFISTARSLVEWEIPFLGVNLGTVGFLADLSTSDWRERLPAVLEGGYTITRNLLLSFKVWRRGAVRHQGVAVNDIVISRGALARLIRLGFLHDGRSVISMRSDGVVVSTPTGSSAYGVSAGGPLLVPGVEAFSVVPICPFLNGFKPLVLPAGKRLEIEVQGDPSDVTITEDGQVSVPIAAGDVIEIERHERDLLLAETGHSSYFDKLKAKGFLVER
jgi:NAD+ kinase